MRIGRHHLSYRPLFPHARWVRTGGVIQQKAWVCIWLWWIMEAEVRP